MMFRKILCYCLFLLCNVNLSSYQKELPLPFWYFENLYFEPKTSTFLTDLTHVEEAFDVKEKRGCFFTTLKNPQKNPQKISGTTLILFEKNLTKTYLNHFFHILEHICGCWAFYGDLNFQDVGLIILAGNGDKSLSYEWKGPNEINKHLLKALFPYAEVKTWKEFFTEYNSSTTLCFERAITSDRSLESTSPDCTSINKMLGKARHYISAESIKHLSDKVHSYAKSKTNTCEKLRVTYLKRNPPRCLHPTLEKTLLSSIQLLEGVSLQVQDLAKIPFSEQINIIGNTDVLVSVHGNGLSHILFLPSSAKIIEIFPPGAHTLDYRLFADLKGLDYTGITPEKGIVIDSYKLGAYGDFDVTINQLDISLILAKLKEFSHDTSAPDFLLFY